MSSIVLCEKCKIHEAIPFDKETLYTAKKNNIELGDFCADCMIEEMEKLINKFDGKAP